MRIYSMLFILMFFSGCGSKVSIDSEFSKLKRQAQSRVHESISRKEPYHENYQQISEVDAALNAGLSRDDAVRIALMNNADLRAEFENLGIAKSDLVQAGLYTNPKIESIFRFPTRTQESRTTQTSIESTAHFRLSDLWQVPLTKNIAEDLLEIVSLRILNMILMLVADTQIAYDACLAAQSKVSLSEQLLAVYRELLDEVYYRQHYGYTTDLDIYTIDNSVDKIEALLLQARTTLDESFIHLKQLLGVCPSKKPIVLTSMLEKEIIIPSLKVLRESALSIRPEVHIAHMKVQQYYDSIKLERAKIFKEIDIGVSFEQDFEKPLQGWGPYVNIELPFFDTNYAQIARSQYLYDQAEKELKALEIKIKEEVATPYYQVHTLKKKVDIYKNDIIPSDQKAFDFAYTYAQNMQLPATVFYEAHIKLLEDKITLIDYWYHLRKEYALLEKSVGEKIDRYNAVLSV